MLACFGKGGEMLAYFGIRRGNVSLLWNKEGRRSLLDLKKVKKYYRYKK